MSAGAGFIYITVLLPLLIFECTKLLSQLSLYDGMEYGQYLFQTGLDSAEGLSIANDSYSSDSLYR